MIFISLLKSETLIVAQATVYSLRFLLYRVLWLLILVGCAGVSTAEIFKYKCMVSAVVRIR